MSESPKKLRVLFCCAVTQNFFDLPSSEIGTVWKATGAMLSALRDLPGVGALSAAKIVAEVADVRRFKSKDAFARHNGTAPLPVWSSNHPRHRLSRTGNRQLNAAIHRMALTQARCHEPAIVFLKRRASMGNTRSEARRALKRRLSDVIYRTLLLDAEPAQPACLEAAA